MSLNRRMASLIAIALFGAGSRVVSVGPPRALPIEPPAGPNPEPVAPPAAPRLAKPAPPRRTPPEARDKGAGAAARRRRQIAKGMLTASGGLVSE